jgi:hypothetical protein
VEPHSWNGKACRPWFALAFSSGSAHLIRPWAHTACRISTSIQQPLSLRIHRREVMHVRTTCDHGHAIEARADTVVMSYTSFTHADCGSTTPYLVAMLACDSPTDYSCHVLSLLRTLRPICSSYGSLGFQAYFFCSDTQPTLDAGTDLARALSSIL